MINLTRQLGGSVGIAAFSTLLTRRDDFHRSALVSHLTDANPSVSFWLSHAQVLMQTHGESASTAKQGALALLSRIVEAQAAMLSFNDAFLMITVAFLLTLPLILMFKKSAVSVDASAAH